MFSIWRNLKTLLSPKPELQTLETQICSNSTPQALSPTSMAEPENPFSPTATHNSTSTKNTPRSTYKSAVCLKDWWLVKADEEFNGKSLAVAGFTVDGQHSMQLFFSAPIIKRYDMFTLEAADGTTVSIGGFLNKTRTNENGFSSEAFSQFLAGFPFNWEDVACHYMHKSTANLFTGNVSGLSNAQDNHKDDDSKGNSHMEKTEKLSADTSSSSAAEMNVEVVVSPDVERNASDDSLSGNAISGIEQLLNPSTRKGKLCSTETFRIDKSNTLKVPRVDPSKNDMHTPGDSSRRLRPPKMVGNLTNRINTILSRRSTDPNLCSSVSKDYPHKRTMDVDDRFCDANSSSLSHINVDSVIKKLFTSPNDHSELSEDLTICTADAVEEDGNAKHLSVGIGSDGNGANPSEVNMIAPLGTKSNCLRSLSKGLESSNSEMKTKVNTKGYLKSKRLRNLKACRAKDDSPKDDSVLVNSTTINIVPSEVKRVVITSNDKCKETESSFKLRRSGRLKKAIDTPVYRLKDERNKVDFVLVSPDFATNAVDEELMRSQKMAKRKAEDITEVDLPVM